jgi:hypothetical protein
MPITFSSTLQQHGSGCAVEVSAEIMHTLGSGKRLPVRVVINGITLRTTIAAYGGRSYIGLRREIREAARVVPGETVELCVELDDDERTVEVPEDFKATLAADPEVSRAFERLSYSNRKEYVDWVLGAKKAETRQKRLADAPGLLKSGRRTPLQ